MNAISIDEHTPHGWRQYSSKFGFVPDPMILRAGEVFLNGEAAASGMYRNPYSIWDALRENIYGIIEFFDMLVTRDRIPLIGYSDTFDADSLGRSLPTLLGDKVCEVTIGQDVYRSVKEGALVSLGQLDVEGIGDDRRVVSESAAFLYDWKPHLSVLGSSDPDVQKAADKLSCLDGVRLEIGQYLLGGLIFAGFAQASFTENYIQPKRSRLLLGLIKQSGPRQLPTAQDEDVIFENANRDLRGVDITVRNYSSLPPVLPYLLSERPVPATPTELLEKALEFPSTNDGRLYNRAIRALRRDGVDARRVEDMSEHERELAVQFLSPYTKLDNRKSETLELKVGSELFGMPPGLEVSVKPSLPKWVRVLWNDHIRFGGMHKTLRRMWMAEQSYNDLQAKIRDLWRTP